MPFLKISRDKYKSPSGKIYSKKQVQAYYASDGFKHKLIKGKKKNYA